MELQLTFLWLWLLLHLTLAADFLDVLKGDGFGGAKKRLVVNRIGQCPGHKNLPIYFTDFKVSQYNATNYVVNGEVIFKEDFPNGWTGSATVKRCDDFSAAANCRPFLNNIANTDVCTLLAASDAMYTRYFDKMVPKPQCPFKKGSYILKDQLVEDDVARFLPGSGSTYWEVRSSGKIGDRMVLCFILQLNSRPRKTKES
ncbi:uncharacterized protein LOC135708567 [Ochlerotatus camptorhynchus]|uniref:uncharacterized protein LOC135708567 n=1 Tax=Ochlerotatus camptorhynchus TaxID=644619 RepID=UPI0031CDF04F